MNTYDFFLFAGQSNMAGRGISCPQFPEAAPALISGAYFFAGDRHWMLPNI